MKNIIVSLSILFFVYLMSSCNSEKSNTTANQETPSADTNNEQQLCFLRVTRGEPIVTEEDTLPVIDSLIIRLVIKNDSVAGVYNWLPSQKDRLTGSLKGTLKGDVVTAIHTYGAEGTTAREEKVMKIGADSIWIKHGELQEKEGVWVLEDKEAAQYTESAPKVNCK